MRTFHTCLLSLIIMALSACALLDNYKRVVPGTSTGASVMEIYGLPVHVWRNDDGGRTLEYSSQPYGRTCYMIRLDAADKVLSIENTLTLAGQARVSRGMTKEQVSRLLGRERTRQFFSLSGEEVWDWTVDPESMSYERRFNVHFKDGRVVRTSFSMLDPRDVQELY